MDEHFGETREHEPAPPLCRLFVCGALFTAWLMLATLAISGTVTGWPALRWEESVHVACASASCYIAGWVLRQDWDN